MEYNIIDEKIISETELKEQYEDKINKNFEIGKKLLEHMSKNIKIKDFNAVFEELNALNLDIREDYLRMIIDISPNTADQVRAILSPLKNNIAEEDIKKILALIKKYS